MEKNPVRRIIIKNYGKDKFGNKTDMNYTVGQDVYGGHQINSIIEEENGGCAIYISKDGEVFKWKYIHANIATIVEYTLDF